MDAKSFASKINRVYKKENGFPMTENGQRIRVTAEAAKMGSDVVEVGNTFYYRSQACIPSSVASVMDAAEVAGVTVKMTAIGEVSFHMRQWPNDSWATQFFRVEVA